ncbi:ABC-F family ATP-binding cassette domain-containing protein [Megasphaera paucivorans]|uniref:ATP-binding cassette, subfamily F, uup n=1 Tax=Megasphaera paucivorans TaxID=349095 RepID=A0A1G9S303_9FIRM|nr:ABC-F family ATP-binding cassette domain-containing protein [Megasphaera paucivorans]SDM29802.1 ATP-binding cassette, subfamily F, uup [Megasphaera paucivorans]
MNIVTAENVKKSYGMRVLFDNVHFSIDVGQKIGLIGLNGAGKSTLLRIIAGQVETDSGEIQYNQKARIHFLPQEPEFVPGRTVLESVLDGDLPVMALLRSYEAAVQHNDNKAVADLMEDMDRLQAWELEQKAKIILQQLGIDTLDQVVDTLSGGQRKRVGLARALILPCDLLIMDEPTNHLDDTTIVWLEQYLHDSPSALLLSTHDRYFLDQVIDSMLELDRGKVYAYNGNYAQYLELHQQRLEQEEASEAKRRNLIRRETAWIKRGAQARSTKQKARKERYEQLCAMESGKPTGTVEILDTSTRLGKTILDIDDVSFAYEKKEPLFRHVTYHVVKHDRIGIIGENGAGKSTLLNVLAGQLSPTEGNLTIGQTVRFGFFTQQLPAFDENQRVIEYVQEHGAYVTNQFGRTVSASQLLEQFLFTEEMQWTYIYKLSGGERRRLYLLRILMEQPNVLLLDEPTNDLDIPTLIVLEQYLDTYQGVVLTVSHDRYFLDRVADTLFILERGTWRRYYGDYSEYLLEKSVSHTEKSTITYAAGEEKSCSSKILHQEKKGLTFREKEELETITRELPGYEKMLTGLNHAVAAAGSNYEQLESVLKEQQDMQEKVEYMTARWCELEDKNQ